MVLHIVDDSISIKTISFSFRGNFLLLNRKEENNTLKTAQLYAVLPPFRKKSIACPTLSAN